MVVSAAIAATVIGYESGIACGTLLYIDKEYPNITLAEKSVRSSMCNLI